MRVLVTGGVGYVGWSVGHELAQRDGVEEIVVYDNYVRRNHGLLLGEKPAGKASIRGVVGDILNSRALREAMQGIDCVRHLAAIAPSPNIDDSPHRFDQVNNWGTAEVRYAVEASSVPRLLNLSSGAVYGHSEKMAGVDREPMAVNAYGRSKRAGEKQVERLSSRCTSNTRRQPSSGPAVMARPAPSGVGGSRSATCSTMLSDGIASASRVSG